MEWLVVTCDIAQSLQGMFIDRRRIVAAFGTIRATTATAFGLSTISSTKGCSSGVTDRCQGPQTILCYNVTCLLFSNARFSADIIKRKVYCIGPGQVGLS